MISCLGGVPESGEVDEDSLLMTSETRFNPEAVYAQVRCLLVLQCNGRIA